MRFSTFAALLVIVALPASQASAQRDDQFAFSVGAGATIPSGVAADNHTIGIHGTLSWGIGSVDSPLGIRFDGTYFSLGDKSGNGGPIDQGSARTFMFSGNGIFNLYGSNTHVYGIAGLGGYWYNPNGQGTSARNDLGLQAGIGVWVPYMNAFVEAKWLNLYRAMPDPESGVKGKKSARLYPVTLGFIF
jgi:hypothetical protein